MSHQLGEELWIIICRQQTVYPSLACCRPRANDNVSKHEGNDTAKPIARRLYGNVCGISFQPQMLDSNGPKINRPNTT